MKTAAEKAARERFIKIVIEAGSRGATEAAAVRDMLQKRLDDARAAYIEAATLYGASYERDISRAAAALETVRHQLTEKRAEAAAVRDNLKTIEQCGTKEKADAIRTQLLIKETEAAELQKKAAELAAYIPAGDPALLKAAELADHNWRSEKATADRITAGITKKLDRQAAELRQAQTEIRTGVISAVYIPAAMKVAEIRHKGKHGHQLREILKRREKADAFITELRDRIRSNEADTKGQEGEK